MLSGMLKSAWRFYSAIISRGPPVAKAPDENGSDCEERKLGEQNGLDSGSFGRKTKKHN